MIKSQIRNLGGKAIVKEKKSHQETFDELSQTPGVDQQFLAEELSKIPSSGKVKSTASLRYTFIACLAFLGVLRMVGIVMAQIEIRFDLRFVLFVVILSLIAPAAGIYAALFHKIHFYRTAGILLIFGLYQSIKRGQLALEAESLLVLIPFAAAVFLAFYIPSKLKTPYKKSITENFKDGKLTKEADYVFEDTRMTESDILDATF
jgi:hypothetical protein